jgi:NADPH:quinone reductase-like Zn-dependent oxidoreductase
MIISGLSREGGPLPFRAMRAIWNTKAGGPDVLEVRETEDPPLEKGHVRVRVKAAGLNFAEVSARQGLYPDAPPFPMVAGYEAAGEIAEVAAGTEAPAPGTRVIALSRFGAHADNLVVPAGQVIEMPEGMTFEEGAALPVNYITAYHMLFRVACIRPREKVLVHMAAGGVGFAVIQLAKTVEGVEIFGTASASKHDAIRAEGCHHPIDYHTVDYVEEVLRITGGKGVDVVLDPLGGRDWKRGMSILRPVGRLVAFGFANMVSGSKRSIFRVAHQIIGLPMFTPLALMDKNLIVAGVNIGHLWSEMEMLTEEMQALVDLYRAGKIKPRIDQVFPFDRAADAHRRIETRGNVGKVILAP